MLFIIAIIATIVAFFVYRNAKKRMNRSESSFALIGFVVALIIALSQCWTVIPAGHTGVVITSYSIHYTKLYELRPQHQPVPAADLCPGHRGSAQRPVVTGHDRGASLGRHPLRLQPQDPAGAGNPRV